MGVVGNIHLFLGEQLCTALHVRLGGARVGGGGGIVGSQSVGLIWAGFDAAGLGGAQELPWGGRALQRPPSSWGWMFERICWDGGFAGLGGLSPHLRQPQDSLRSLSPTSQLLFFPPSALSLQNRQTFNSLTCLSAAAEDGSQRLPGPQPWTAAPRSPEVMPGRTPACTPVPEPPRSHRASRDDLSCEEEEDGGGKEEDGAAWRSGGTGAESLFQLDGEIDIEQIENN